MRRQLCAALLISLIPTYAWTATTENKNESTNQNVMQINEANGQKNKVDGDLDKEISNARLRAESGSKSKWSGSAAMNYKGGSVSRPFGTERPNLSGLPDTQVDTSLDATFRARYRQNKNMSLSAGVSLGMKTPLQGDVNENENQVNVGDPLIGQNFTWAGMGLQNSVNFTTAIGTSDESKNVERIGGIGLDYSLVKKFSRLSVGVTTSAWYDAYNSEPGENPLYRQKAGMEKVDKRVDWGYTFTPYAEYALTDKINLRALFAYFRWKHLYGDGDNYRLLRIKEYNSVGVGIAVIRDVYLYPNVQFLPRDAKLEYTNVGVSATMNVF